MVLGGMDVYCNIGWLDLSWIMWWNMIVKLVVSVIVEVVCESKMKSFVILIWLYLELIVFLEVV